MWGSWSVIYDKSEKSLAYDQQWKRMRVSKRTVVKTTVIYFLRPFYIIIKIHNNIQNKPIWLIRARLNIIAEVYWLQYNQSKHCLRVGDLETWVYRKRKKLQCIFDSLWWYIKRQKSCSEVLIDKGYSQSSERQKFDNLMEDGWQSRERLPNWFYKKNFTLTLISPNGIFFKCKEKPFIALHKTYF